jgi:hypothetical protein
MIVAGHMQSYRQLDRDFEGDAAPSDSEDIS